jgi:hypothetical protein
VSASRARRPKPPRPLPGGDTLFTPDPSPARASIEQRSATTLLWLHQLPRWLLPLLAVALLVTGLAVAGWAGAIALFAVAGVLGWLAAVSWPKLSAQGRALRVLAVALVIAAAVVRGLHG